MYDIEITQQNLFQHKLTVSGNIYSPIETTLTKTAAFHRYIEIIPKNFLMAAESEIWDHEDILNRDSSRKFAVSMTTNKDSFGSGGKIRITCGSLAQRI